jgi:hypothetical protein
VTGALGLALLACVACSASVASDEAGGAGGEGAGGVAGTGNGGVSGMGGSPCATPEGVRICGGTSDQCAWVGSDECPGGGCARPFDRILGGDAAGGVCFADLPDWGNRACWGCHDGEVCIERKQGELMCVPESVCAALWQLGVRGACRYADSSAYDGRPLLRLPSCPDPSAGLRLCGGPCDEDCQFAQLAPCAGRSPDHPQGFCFIPGGLCSLDESGYTRPCPAVSSSSYCGVYRVSDADAPVARQYGQCLADYKCLALSAKLPGGFECYDADASLVVPP